MGVRARFKRTPRFLVRRQEVHDEKRIWVNVEIPDIDAPIGFRALLCTFSCSRIYNELTLHAPVVNAAVRRTTELVGPRSFRDKFDLCFFALLELPTVVLLWRVKLEAWADWRISAIGNDRDFEAVISVNRRDFELDSYSRFDMDGRRREFVLFRGHPDDSHIVILYLRDSFRPLS